MEENNVYLVNMARGSHSDYSEWTLFATMDPQIAINYIDKYNKLLEKLCYFYLEKFDETRHLASECDEASIWAERYYKICEEHSARVRIVSLR